MSKNKSTLTKKLLDKYIAEVIRAMNTPYNGLVSVNETDKPYAKTKELEEFVKEFVENHKSYGKPITGHLDIPSVGIMIAKIRYNQDLNGRKSIDEIHKNQKAYKSYRRTEILNEYTNYALSMLNMVTDRFAIEREYNTDYLVTLVQNFIIKSEAEKQNQPNNTKTNTNAQKPFLFKDKARKLTRQLLKIEKLRHKLLSPEKNDENTPTYIPNFLVLTEAIGIKAINKDSGKKIRSINTTKRFENLDFLVAAKLLNLFNDELNIKTPNSEDDIEIHSKPCTKETILAAQKLLPRVTLEPLPKVQEEIKNNKPLSSNLIGNKSLYSSLKKLGGLQWWHVMSFPAQFMSKTNLAANPLQKVVASIIEKKPLPCITSPSNLIYSYYTADLEDTLERCKISIKDKDGNSIVGFVERNSELEEKIIERQRAIDDKQKLTPLTIYFNRNGTIQHSQEEQQEISINLTDVSAELQDGRIQNQHSPKNKYKNDRLSPDDKGFGI